MKAIRRFISWSQRMWTMRVKLFLTKKRRLCVMCQRRTWYYWDKDAVQPDGTVECGDCVPI